MNRLVTLGSFTLYIVLGASADGASESPVCGTGANAGICFASIDKRGKVTPEQRARLAEVGTRAIDIVSTPEFEQELTAFYQAYDWRSRDAKHRRYWEVFDPKTAAASIRLSFAGLHIETKGGIGAWFAANNPYIGNLAYEGRDRPGGYREILLNRNRLDRPLSGLVATYVHEAAHKAGYSHRDSQNEDQKCEPPYVMGQIAQKLADPNGWPDFGKSANACRFWRGD